MKPASIIGKITIHNDAPKKSSLFLTQFNAYLRKKFIDLLHVVFQQKERLFQLSASESLKVLDTI